jgi:hypothetical protein
MAAREIAGHDIDDQRSCTMNSCCLAQLPPRTRAIAPVLRPASADRRNPSAAPVPLASAVCRARHRHLACPICPAWPKSRPRLRRPNPPAAALFPIPDPASSPPATHGTRARLATPGPVHPQPILCGHPAFPSPRRANFAVNVRYRANSTA